MEIRPIEERDLSAFARLMGELMGGAPTDSVLLRENFAALQSDESSCVLGAFDDSGDLLGSVYLIFCRDFVDDCRPFAVIENVIVAKSARGTGCGGALMREAERLCRKRRCTYMMLVSSENRKTAHGMYEHLGFDVPVRGFKKYLDE